MKTFKDNEPGDQHEAFVEWMNRHPSGFVLNKRPGKPALLHRTKCRHLHGPHQVPEEGQSLTRRLKACSNHAAELSAWARKQHISVKPCNDC
jgi:hypothetical protein